MTAFGTVISVAVSAAAVAGLLGLVRVAESLERRSAPEDATEDTVEVDSDFTIGLWGPSPLDTDDVSN